MKWLEPEDDGGTEITGYVLEKRDITRSAWSNSMSTQELEFTVPKLVKDKQYLVRVAAENQCGLGPFVELEKPVTAKCPFGKCSCKASVVNVYHCVTTSTVCNLFMNITTDKPGAPENPQVSDITSKSCTINLGASHRGWWLSSHWLPC